MRIEEIKLVKDLIGESKIDKAIFFLKSKLSGKSKDELILISSRYEEILRKNRIGTLSSEELSVSQSQVSSALIELVNNIDTKSFPSSVSIYQPSQNRNIIWLIAGGIIISLVILLTILHQKEVVGIKGDNNDNNNIEINN